MHIYRCPQPIFVDGLVRQRLVSNDKLLTKYFLKQKIILQIIPLLGFLLFVYVGLRGLDFGNHWDEYGNHIVPLRAALERGSLLPQWYWMPSFNHDLALVNLLPFIVSYLIVGEAHDSSLTQYLIGVIEQPDFILRMRFMTCFITGLSIFWIFIASRRLTRSIEAASFACALLGSCWELSYHARWYTADPIVMQFIALALIGIVSPGNPSYPQLKLAAVATGLACATKYPAGAFMAAVLVLHILSTGDKNFRRRGVDMLKLCLTFTFTYLAVTPGTIFEVGIFFRDVYQQKGETGTLMFFGKGKRGHTCFSGVVVYLDR